MDVLDGFFWLRVAFDWVCLQRDIKTIEVFRGHRLRRFMPADIKWGVRQEIKTFSGAFSFVGLC